MDFKQLKYFTHIADFGNMTRASEALHIAQPALSQQMANLESELGTPVFSRSPQGVKLTPAGDVLYRHSRSLLKQLDDARMAVRDANEHPSGSVAVGIPGSTGKVLSVPLLREVAAHDRIVLEIVERPSAELLSLVARGRLDIAVVVDAQACHGVTISPMLIEDLYVILPREEVGMRRSLTLKDMATQPLILPSAPSTIRQRIDSSFMNARLKYRLAGEVSSTDMLIRVVVAGLGWTLLPWAAVGDELECGLVSALPIARHRLRRELSVCSSDAVPLSRASEVVRGLVLSIVDDLVTSGSWKGVEAVRR